MRIFINQEKRGNINELLLDPAIEEAAKFWGDKDLYKKSSIEMSTFLSPFNSISILHGPRQIGKTASLKLFLHQVKDSDTLAYTDCSTILERADLAKHIAAIAQGKTTLVLDEVQEVPQWPLALRSLYSEGLLKNCRIWCTGSEARHLLESGERLPGRKGEGKVIFARPWSFREYMDLFHSEKIGVLKSFEVKHISQEWLDQKSPDWSPEWNSYLQSGGIPRLLAETKTKGRISDQSWKIYSDWILGTWSKHRISEISQSALARRIIETMNSRISYETLKQGTDINSSNTVKALIDAQVDHFALRVLTKLDLHKKKLQAAKQKKIYPPDPFIARIWQAIGLRIRRQFEEKLSPLSLDECAFFTQTFRRENVLDVHYLYSETKQSEIDFFIDGYAFELKSNGSPTKAQRNLMNEAERAFVLRKKTLPVVAYLLGEPRAL